MLVRYLTILCVTVAVVGFFASRPTEMLSQQTDYKELLSQLHNRPLTDSQITQIVKSGEPTLDVVLDEFMGSDFVIDLRKQIKKGFNLGQAIDKNVYASNVIRVVEAFGTAGVERLIKRLPPHVVKLYRFDSPEYRRLGSMTVKPLLTTEIFSSLRRKIGLD
jgi:hypothetical protein